MNRSYAKVITNEVMQVATINEASYNALTDKTQWIDVTYVQPVPKEGWLFDRNSNTFRPRGEDEIRLEQARSRIIQELDKAAGEVRSVNITESLGQSEVYREKYDQAIDFLTNPGEPTNSFPLLLVECEIHNCDLENAANRVITARKRWLSVITSIERIRMTAKKELITSSNITEMMRIKSDCIHALSNIKGR